MQNLLTGLLTKLSPKAPEQCSSYEVLDEIVTRLERQQVELEQHLSREAHAGEKRRLKIALEVAQLQLKKALTLRSNLSHL